MKRMVFEVIRFVIVFLCFIMDVRVRAAESFYSVISQSGSVEFDQLNANKVDVEAFKGAMARLKIQKSIIGLESGSFVTIDPSEVQVHFGRLFFSTKDKSIKVQAKHINIEIGPDSQVVIEGMEHKTTVSVLSGGARVLNRLGSEKALKAGYQIWVGGLRADGTKAAGKPEALDFDNCSEVIKNFGGVATADLDVALDHLRSHWRAAVEDVALQNQDEINGDIKIYNEWKSENRKRDLASVKEKNEMKMRFRAHALDLPYQNEEVPSE